MKTKLPKNNKRGFALLFSVLISSLLLTIGLSIFGIALKELAISTAARQSIHAFFAADSGREYAIYKDIKIGDILPFDFSKPDTYTTSTGEIFGSVAGSEANYVVIIEKRWHDSSRTKVDTTVTARGYDSTVAGDRVERAIEQTY